MKKLNYERETLHKEYVEIKILTLEYSELVTTQNLYYLFNGLGR